MTRLTFSPADFVKLLPRLCNAVQSLDGKKQYDIEIKEHRQRRSLDANAYLWALLDKVAVELSKESPVSPEDVYKQLIPHVGGNSKILPIREDAVDAWKNIWSAGRTGWICEDMGPCVNYCLICYGNGHNDPLNRHEVFGGAYRSKSKRLGLWRCLCHSRHHQHGPESVHQNAETSLWLKRLAQHMAMEKYGWSMDDFIREFGKNYLEE